MTDFRTEEIYKIRLEKFSVQKGKKVFIHTHTHKHTFI